MREKTLLSLFAAMEKPLGALDCEYYPCHFEGQDCSFCYCPFYPCFIYKLGGHLTRSKNKVVWSCKNCTWVHERSVVEEITLYFSNFPKQKLVEEDWYFFSRALQQILFGKEIGKWIGKCYSLIEANMVERSEKRLALLVELKDFEIVSVREISRFEGEGVVIPLKVDDEIYGIIDGCI